MFVGFRGEVFLQYAKENFFLQTMLGGFGSGVKSSSFVHINCQKNERERRATKHSF